MSDKVFRRIFGFCRYGSGSGVLCAYALFVRQSQTGNRRLAVFGNDMAAMQESMAGQREYLVKGKTFP